MKITSDKIDELVDHLQGTTDTLGCGCETIGVDEDDLSSENLEQIDNAIFNCSACGWWCDISENVGEDDMICADCEDE